MLENMDTLIKNTCFIVCTFIVLFYLLDVIFRAVYLLYEINDMNNVNDNFTAFNYNRASIAVMLISLLLFFVLKPSDTKELLEYVWKQFLGSFFVCIGIGFLVWRCMNASEFRLVKDCSEHIVNDLNYGKGMAFSYYYGYLQLVLPSTGTESKGLVERIGNFEDTNNVTIPVKKLFILIPASLYIPPDLKEASNGWMESTSPMEEELRNRAGVVRRSYRNNVYKIYSEGKRDREPTYVVAEGATPILTFFEVLKHSHKETEVYKKYHKDIVMEFCFKLQELIQENPECRDLVEIVYYDDYDSMGKKVNVAQIIIDRIADIVSKN